MALTIDTSPTNQHQLAYRPIIWKVSSDDAEIIRVIADVRINTVFKTSVEKSPDFGTTDEFTFDFANIAQDFIKSWDITDLDSGTAKLYADINTQVQFEIRFFEVTSDGTTTTTPWLPEGAGGTFLNSTTVHAPSLNFNGTLRHEETQDVSVWKTTGIYSGMSRLNLKTETFVGNPTNKARKIKRGDYAVVSTWHNTTATIRGKYVQFDSSDLNILNANTTNLSSSSRFWQFGIDTSILLSNAKTLLMKFETNTGSSAITDFTKFEIVEDCGDFVSLYWANDIGGIDYFLFRDGKVKSFNSDTVTYEQPLPSTFDSGAFGTTVLNKRGFTEIRANSEVIDRVQADALSNLITHAVRAWIYTGDIFVPVIVDDASMRTIDTEDGAYRLNIKLIHSNVSKAQKF